MKKLTLLIAFCVVVTAAAAFRQHGRGSGRVALPSDADFGVTELVRAQPFRLDEPYRHEWRSDGGSVAAGYLVVLRVDPARSQPVQALAPVLYAGNDVLERVNYGESGIVVGVLPSAVGADGQLALDLGTTPFWFGTAELPERVDAARIASERQSATRAGLRAPDADAIARARSRDLELLELRDRSELQRVAARWILEHAPSEGDFAQLLLLPAPR